MGLVESSVASRELVDGFCDLFTDRPGISIGVGCVCMDSLGDGITIDFLSGHGGRETVGRVGKEGLGYTSRE